MPTSRDMRIAAASKKDEFYTLYSDIEEELRHYRNHFRDKTVFCNCDDPFESSFFKYFVYNFNKLGLKRLAATSFAKAAEKSIPRVAIVGVVPKGIVDFGKLFSLPGNSLDRLKGDGDFRSPECVELLKNADIVATNPPFSLFREYTRQLVEHDKKFLIIGNVNAVTYKEFFPLLMHDKVWIGPSIHSGDRKFHVPDDYPLEAAGCGFDPETGRKFIKVKGVRWFTNMDFGQRRRFLALPDRYSEDAYPFYDNYNAIAVGSTRKIPGDYPYAMGVPITFLDKYNPEQFQIMGADFQVKDGLLPSMIRPGWRGKIDRGYINGQRQYARILIRNRHPVGDFAKIKLKRTLAQGSLFANGSDALR